MDTSMNSTTSQTSTTLPQMAVQSATPENLHTFDLKNYLDFEKIDDIDYLKEEKHLKVYKKDDSMVLKYDKSHLTSENTSTLGMFRSIILKHGKPVSFCPPKSFSLTPEVKSDFDGTPQKYLVEEFVEGTMINVYHDGSDWECATRSLIGARGKFYKDYPTFRTMFLEATNTHDLEFSDLDPTYVYSFVLSHPQNRIVCKVETPMLKLVQIYKCNDDYTVTQVNKYHSHFTVLQSKVPYVNAAQYPTMQQVESVFAKYRCYSLHSCWDSNS